MLEQRIRDLGPWFHNMVLDGVETAPDHFLGDYPRAKFRRFASIVPEDLGGKSVLDVGCNAGFYAFEMKRRGASRVVAIDSDDRYLAQARLASEVLGHEIELRKLDVYRVAELRERFDLVLFMGVLYHLRHPLLALDRLFDHVVGERMLFQSLLRGPATITPIDLDYAFEEKQIFLRQGYPAIYFVEHSYASDWTNWWIPNRAGVEAMLRSAGFAIERRVEDDVYLCRRKDRRSVESADAEMGSDT
jgi:tRNA (mo5U34)-methyltransferase